MRHTLGFLLMAAVAAAAPQPGTITIDTQEWRTEPAKHLYIHGTLNGDTPFHVYMPERAAWKGRVMQYLQGGLGGSEVEGVRMGNHGFALANGAVYVESGQGHKGGTFFEPENTAKELAYEANYAVVQYARSRCVELYGKEPAYTYVWGGSGGGVRSTELMERFPKLYDGAVPVVGAGNLLYFVFLHSMYEAYRPVVQPKAAAIAAATRVPGQGDPFAALSSERERDALRKVFMTGFPRNSAWLLRPLPVGLTVLDFMKYKTSPEYFEAFWTDPRYAASAADFKPALVEGIEGTVQTVDNTGRRFTIDLKRPDHDFFGYTLVFTSGALKGQWRRVLSNIGSTIALGTVGPDAVAAKPGDKFTLNNRDILAWRALHRHIVDDPQDPAMRWLFENGRPKYAQVPPEMLEDVAEPDRTIGRIQGKMIMVFGTDDFLMFPTVAVRYHRRVRERLGAKADDHYRLHFIEHGVHGAVAPGGAYCEVPNHAYSRKALTEMIAWVEQGVAPVPGTSYSVDELNQIVLPKTAAARRGYQSVVWLTVKQDSGETVLHVEAEDPDNDVVRIEVDYNGTGKFEDAREVRGRRVAAEYRHRYEPGKTYYPGVRVTDATTSVATPGPGIQNIAIARVN